MAHIATVNPIVSQGYAFDPTCPVTMIVTRGYGPVAGIVVKSIPFNRHDNRSCIKRSIMGRSILDKECD